MNSRYAICESREIHYTEWGAEHRDTVIAWHGLARTGRDMDDIAAHLALNVPEQCSLVERFLNAK
jgi:hypothetical protein